MWCRDAGAQRRLLRIRSPDLGQPSAEDPVHGLFPALPGFLHADRGEDYCPVAAPEEDYSKMSNDAIEMSHSDKEGPTRLCAFALGIWVRRLRPPCASLWPLVW